MKKIIHCIWVTICIMMQGLIGAIVIMMAVIATILSYLLRMPLALYGYLKGNIETINYKIMSTLSEKRQLPVFNICGTDFMVDSMHEEFVQVDTPCNTISFKEIGISDLERTELAFDLQIKNIYEDIIDPEHVPGHVKLISIPPLPQLDPMAVTRQQLQSKEAITKIAGQDGVRYTRVITRKRGLKH